LAFTPARRGIGWVMGRDSAGNGGVIGPGDVQAELVLLDQRGSEVRIAAAADSTLLLLSGTPIAEPIVGYGPFVMNSKQEIEAAMNDFRSGKFGRMPALEREEGRVDLV
jgi:redox-sensitive bicupin YhaK (pirin superfamily)